MIDIENILFGYESIDLPKPKALQGTEDWGQNEWKLDFEHTCNNLQNFLSARDPLVILSRTIALHLMNLRNKTHNAGQLEQAHTEITQALILTNNLKFKNVPTSPDNFLRYWQLLFRNLHSFMGQQYYDDRTSDIDKNIIHRARLQTLYYRNLFAQEDCEQALVGILGKIDSDTEKDLGYKLTSLFQACVRIFEITNEKLLQFNNNIIPLYQAENKGDVLKAIDFLKNTYPLCEELWDRCGDQFTDLKSISATGVQIFELGYPWVFTLSRTQLQSEFEPKLLDAIFEMALPLGALSGANLDHIYLNNPVWRKPYIALENGDIYVGLSHLIYSFPFAIIEEKMDGNPKLKIAYEDSRSEYLEEAIETILQTAMPSARIHKGVYWTDPATGKRWENDIVAFIGNYVFVFEAKSGKITEASRRGGDLSLRNNFKELFIEPGIQGWRLQRYIDEYGIRSELFEKNGNRIKNLGFDHPKAVFRYSVCFEHFNSLTSAKLHLKKFNAIENETAWTPILSLGELKMIDRFLDTEISFVHYLSRRSTFEEIIALDGDEQDILSMYLTNGFCIDASKIEGTHLTLMNADSFVRIRKTPRLDRTETEVHGVLLSQLWAFAVKEIYKRKEDRHRFDYINVILNQFPPSLAEIEKRIRRFRRNVPSNDEDIITVKFVVGRRVFVLGCYLAKKRPTHEEWRNIGRSMFEPFLQGYDTAECAAFYYLRRSKERAYDGASFYRCIKGKKKDPISP